MRARVAEYWCWLYGEVDCVMLVLPRTVTSCSRYRAWWDAASRGREGGPKLDMMKRRWDRAGSQRQRERPILARNNSMMASTERPRAIGSTSRIPHAIPKRVGWLCTDIATCFRSVDVTRTRRGWDVPSQRGGGTSRCRCHRDEQGICSSICVHRGVSTARAIAIVRRGVRRRKRERDLDEPAKGES